jgi:GxxExxY protein
MEQVKNAADEQDPLTGRIIGAAIEVHGQLGPGHLESAYLTCLCHELSISDVQLRREVPVPVDYKGIKLDCAYRLDLLVEDEVVVELKAVDKLLPLHTAQLLTCLRLTGLKKGLLINFNVPVLKHGIRRVVN